MKESAVLAREKGVRLHTHLAETQDENDFCLKIFGVRLVDYLERVGWMSDDVWLAHGIHFNDEEITRLGKAGVGVTHCPSSNMVLGSGQCRTLDLEKAGSPVGLGVDGFSIQRLFEFNSGSPSGDATTTLTLWLIGSDAF